MNSSQPSGRFLVTAGGTRERVDAVREWGNVFTGGTGLAIARGLTGMGRVELLTSNAVHLAELKSERSSIEAEGFGSHAELGAALDRRMMAGRYDAVFMTAAVSDYRPAGVFEVVARTGGEGGSETWVVRDVSARKVKSTYREMAVLGQRTEKLVDLFRARWGHRGLLVKFKLEVGVDDATLLAIGRDSRMASGADYLVANTLDRVDGPDAGAFLIGEDGHEWIARPMLASRLAALTREYLERANQRGK